MAAPKTGDISDLQFYYDKCLPGNSSLFNDFDAVTMRLTDISLNVKDCTLDMSKSCIMPRGGSIVTGKHASIVTGKQRVTIS